MNFGFDWIYWEWINKLRKKVTFTCRINEGLPDPPISIWSTLLLCILLRGFEECMSLA